MNTALPFVHNTAHEPNKALYLSESATWLFAEVTSTLNTAVELAQHNTLPEWGSVLAARQTGGRGQLGRSWSSPAGNMYATLRLPVVHPFTSSAAAPAMGGLVAAALAALDIHTHIKWPNDIILLAQPKATPPASPRKIGGILLEERHGYILAGIGINIAHSPPDTLMRKDAAMPAGCLPVSVLQSNGLYCIVDVWLKLVQHMRALACQPFFAQNWQQLTEQRLAFKGRNVRVTDGPAEADITSGRLLGLDAEGGLQLLVSSAGTSNTVTLTAGSLRLPE